MLLSEGGWMWDTMAKHTKISICFTVVTTEKSHLKHYPWGTAKSTLWGEGSSKTFTNTWEAVFASTVCCHSGQEFHVYTHRRSISEITKASSAFPPLCRNLASSSALAGECFTTGERVLCYEGLHLIFTTLILNESIIHKLTDTCICSAYFRMSHYWPQRRKQNGEGKYTFLSLNLKPCSSFSTEHCMKYQECKYHRQKEK